MNAHFICFVTLLSLSLSAINLKDFSAGEVIEYYDEEQFLFREPLIPREIPEEIYYLFFDENAIASETTDYNLIVILSEKILGIYFEQKAKQIGNLHLSKKSVPPYLTAVIIAAKFYNKGMLTKQLWKKIENKANSYSYIKRIKDVLRNYDTHPIQVIKRGERDLLYTIYPEFNFMLERQLLTPKKIPKMFLYLMIKPRKNSDVNLFNDVVIHSEKILEIYFTNMEKQDPENINKIKEDAMPYLMAVLISVKFNDDWEVGFRDLWSEILKKRDNVIVGKLYDYLMEKFSCEIEDEVIEEFKHNVYHHLRIKDYDEIYDEKAELKLYTLLKHAEAHFLHVINWQLFFADLHHLT